MLFFAVHYGNEDIYRATLFALPWLALLAAHIAVEAKKVVNLALPTLLMVLTTAYVVGDMGFDDMYVARPSDIDAALYFERTAPVGSAIISIGGYGGDEPHASGRYPLYSYGSYLDAGLSPGTTANNAASVFTEGVMSTFGPPNSITTRSRVYVFGSQQAATQLADDGVMTLDQYRQFESQLVRSGRWRLVYQNRTAVLLEFEG